ncbi:MULTISPECIES: hypothetical protein [Bacillaceae]|uniref:Lipoprotein n=1 Tax=Evansella alkalicola TaxID=745819 RepID=A0ABS6JU30_9BACI|nr:MULTISPECIES: hypothetical protein [Bacillaceae]MBU9720645.1 hypothetical protein [Bacillus alkalicola]
MKKFLVILIAFLSIFSSCRLMDDNGVTSDMLLAESILQENRAADIIIFNNYVYERERKSEENIEELATEKIGEIEELYRNPNSIRNGMANLLPEGSEVFSTATDEDNSLIVKVNGQWLKYHIIR